MPAISVGRALVGAVLVILSTTASAFAETVAIDGDLVTAGDQATVDLGSAQPDQDVGVDVGFRLDCSGTSHIDAGQALHLSPGTRSIPSGGGFSVGSLTLTPGAGWPADGADCPSGLAPVTGTLHMVVTAPPDPGTDFRYSFSWNRSLVPTTTSDAGVLEGTNPTVVFLLDVSDNTPPSLDLPADMTVEATSPAGAAASWTATATDLEDTVPPTPACVPASGSTFAFGDTTVTCSATDSGVLSTSGSFVVHVADTTAPTLVGMPSDQAITTGDPAGATLTYAAPTAADVADASPTVGCLPASGTQIPLGTTTVTCTARDASGNHAAASFEVVVTYVPPVVWSAIWGEPVATNGSRFVANPGRTVPVKVDILADGVRQTRGSASLSLATCAGTAVGSMAMSWSGGRWNAGLDTSALGGPGCYLATASLDGHTAGSFRIDLRGVEPAAGNTAKGRAKA